MTCTPNALSLLRAALAAAEPSVPMDLYKLTMAFGRLRGRTYLRGTSKHGRPLEATLGSPGLGHPDPRKPQREALALVSNVWWVRPDGVHQDAGSFPVHVRVDPRTHELVVLADPGRVPPTEIGRGRPTSASAAARWILECIRKHQPLKEWE